ncbi:MAG TPA: VWA domain-containing protein [Candidatus Polarisedimenticolaceae bacterium]|nr:VWA domain-containing protein [Candidatus Polarisedimenticolaceae bacterium]
MERVTVKLAQVDVVVRDRDGKFVSGLGPSDFKVLEDGTPLEIVAVDEWGRVSAKTSSPKLAAPATPVAETAVAGEPAPAPEPERRSFMIVFDALGDSTALRMNQAKRAAQEFVRTRFRSGDVGAIYQLDLTTRAMSGITSNTEDLARAIDKVAWMPASSLADQINESVLAYEGIGSHDLAKQRLTQQSAGVAGQLDWTREHVYSSLTDLASVFQGMPGKRTLVLASPGFAMNTTSDQKLMTGGFTPKFQSLIRALANYGVTVYSLDLGSDNTSGDASQAIDWHVAVGKLGMDENVLSDLGLERTLGTNSATSRRQFLGVIAGETGGRMLTDTTLTKAFAAIDDESTHFYRISCRVSVASGSDRYRGFKISVSREHCTVTSRRGRYSDVTPYEQQPANATAGNQVDSLKGYRRLDTRGAATPLPAGAADRIPVVVVIEAIGPVELASSPEGISNLDLDIRIVARVADDVVARYERGFTAVLKKGSDAVKSGFRVEGRLALPPGIYDLQGTVRLATPPQIATWTASVTVPPQPKTPSPALTGPMMILENDAAVPLLSQPAETAAPDPLAVKPGARFLPATASDFVVGQPVLAMFWMRGFTSPENPSAEFAVTFLDAGGGPVTAPSTLVYYGPSSNGELSAIVRLESAALTPGTYFVQISAKAPGAQAPVTRRTAPLIFRSRGTPQAAATSSSAP